MDMYMGYGVEVAKCLTDQNNKKIVALVHGHT